MADNSAQGGTDTIRDLARQGGSVKTQVMQLDIGGASANAEVLVSAGQQVMAASLPVVLASDQPSLPVAVQGTVPVSIAAAPQTDVVLVGQTGSLAVTGSFYPATQPVSGTFWQATQPVSATALPLPTGASTETTVAAILAKLNGSLAVTGSFFQATQPVSGTFWQATQPVSIASMPSTPVTGTFWQATQPVSAAALPLPAGAATETTLAAINTKAPSLGAAVKANSVPVVMASDYLGIEDVYITGQGSQTVLNQNVCLAVAGAGSLDCLGMRSIYIQLVVTTSTITAGIIKFEGSNDNVNWQLVMLREIPDVNGIGVTQWSAQVSQNSNLWVGPTQYRYFRARISTAFTGTAMVGVQAFTLLRPTPFVADSVALSNSSTGNSVTLASGQTLSTLPKATTTTSSTLNSAASTNATSVKVALGQVFSISVSNSGAAAAFVKLYNKASAPTVGTDVPVLTIPVAASSVQVLNFGAQGMALNTGIAFAITNLVADSDTTAVAANQVKVMVAYA